MRGYKIVLLSILWIPVWMRASVNPESDIDYSRPEAWLARPGFDSTAAFVPKDSGYSNLARSGRADVFYIHPTTGMREDVANVPIDDPKSVETGRILLMAQATPFNGIARIYAPRYRQIALHVFEEGEAALQAPMNLAYRDLRRAFGHYVEHDNGGRPFFLVAHSQGSNHALRLLMDVVQGTPLQRRLVAAYLPGMPTPQAVFSRHLKDIPPCATASQIGCVAIWGTFLKGYRSFGDWEAVNVYWDAGNQRWRSPKGMPLVGVNPVSWSGDDTVTPAHLHLGAVPFGVPDTHFSRPVAQLFDVSMDNGYTLVSSALSDALFDDGGIFEQGNYHVFDINLFWADLRANARQRLSQFLIQREQASYPVIAGPVKAEAAVGQHFQLKLDLLNGPAVFNIEGLPQGLNFDPASGEIEGVPAESGHFAVVVGASNGAGASREELALKVATESP
jgi:hypothetical protein